MSSGRSCSGAKRNEERLLFVGVEKAALLPLQRSSARSGCAGAPATPRALLRSPGLEPAQSVYGFSGRAILATNPAFVANIIEDLEQVCVVDLAGIGFLAFGDAGDLDVLA